MASHSFSIILEPQEEGGFTVLVPALPEVITEGATFEECRDCLEDALQEMIAAYQASGQDIPRGRTDDLPPPPHSVS